MISSISGSAPIVNDSGAIKGYRSTKGTGIQIIKKVLFIIILSENRNKNSYLGQIYQKLVKKGKKPKVAIVVCMKKFIIYLNELLKKGVLLDGC